MNVLCPRRERVWLGFLGDANTLLAGLRVHIYIDFLHQSTYYTDRLAEREAQTLDRHCFAEQQSILAYLAPLYSNLSIPAQHNAMFHMCPVCVSLINIYRYTPHVYILCVCVVLPYSCSLGLYWKKISVCGVERLSFTRAACASVMWTNKLLGKTANASGNTLVIIHLMCIKAYLLCAGWVADKKAQCVLQRWK